MATHGTLNMHKYHNCRCAACRKCYNSHYREVQRRKYKKRKQLAYDVVGRECVNCGSVDDIQFDHIDPATKNFTICSKIGNAPWDLLEEELEKCQPLCKPCHIEKTLEENGGAAKHGSLGMYRNHGCRCRSCKKANSVNSGRYRKAHPQRSNF